ncbi:MULTISPECIES: Ig-like domain-containing protein [Micromonospora]|uniref:L,D-transpeptidase n=1 Tax=Micromonospora solifontis TaxID=2487138 RepID=A0ABX9WCM3_9ACTN|nr:MULTISPECIES: Ig-like domain-containing protein [Micromonospora]NES16842.1 L,D-transpeptidase family protein [Micromonospora sp. PPF5-17B]NES38517.1 L,D-transpeptidase family protein [Micromonospora solifontis]NES58481.1 L,D-transpeptidase family protein [Micromonospora sp. PPF5-6]RNL95017.1 L,D-transpeptidase [Micromonospora solifontis]
MGRFAPVGAMVGALVLTASLALAGCGGDDREKPVVAGGGQQGESTATASPSGSAGPAQGPPAPLAVIPADGATRRPVSTEISAKIPEGGTVSKVVLTTANGRPVPGLLRRDGSSWVPSAPLRYGTRYTATVTGTGPDGRIHQGTSTFTTMAKPRSMIGSGLYLFSDRTYGVGMPVVAEFSPGIPKKDRAAVQRRMFVRTDPPQPGAWHWLPNGTQAYYRAPEYWKPGTTLTVRLALAGVPLSHGRYGNVDRSATAKIGRAFEMKVDNATKKMTVYENGALVRTMPVSLGKKSTPSSSGTMVVMEKKESTVFDTRDDPDPANRYVTEIDFAQRLTWGGEYIHAAPWSVAAQGHRNVSHGCVNVSTTNARWLFSRTLIGDPITVRGTERTLEPGNGWTAWSLSWPEFVAGSALPVPEGGEPSAF